MLIYGTALLALMAGALFYAAKIPVEQKQATAPQPAVTLEVVSHPSFTLPDVAGTPRDFSEWDGSHRLLNFWATWCAPCRREIPLLKSFQEEHGEAGFQVLGIAVDFPEQVEKYAVEAEFNYPIVIGEEEAMAVAETSGIDFIGMPFTMIVAADGELLNSHIGEIFEADLEHIVNVLKLMDSGEIDRDAARAALNFP